MVCVSIPSSIVVLNIFSDLLQLLLHKILRKCCIISIWQIVVPNLILILRTLIWGSEHSWASIIVNNFHLWLPWKRQLNFLQREFVRCVIVNHFLLWICFSGWRSTLGRIFVHSGRKVGLFGSIRRRRNKVWLPLIEIVWWRDSCICANWRAVGKKATTARQSTMSSKKIAKTLWGRVIIWRRILNGCSVVECWSRGVRILMMEPVILNLPNTELILRVSVCKTRQSFLWNWPLLLSKRIFWLLRSPLQSFYNMNWMIKIGVHKRQSVMVMNHLLPVVIHQILIRRHDLLLAIQVIVLSQSDFL